MFSLIVGWLYSFRHKTVTRHTPPTPLTTLQSRANPPSTPRIAPHPSLRAVPQAQHTPFYKQYNFWTTTLAVLAVLSALTFFLVQWLYQDWTAHKDFLEYCQSIQEANKTVTASCDQALTTPLPPPPFSHTQVAKHSIRNIGTLGVLVQYNGRPKLLKRFAIFSFFVVVLLVTLTKTNIQWLPTSPDEEIALGRHDFCLRGVEGTLVSELAPIGHSRLQPGNATAISTVERSGLRRRRGADNSDLRTIREMYLQNQVEWPEQSNRYFVPIDVLRDIGQPSVVRRELQRFDLQIEAKDRNIVDLICNYSTKLFVLLSCVPHKNERRSAIQGLISERITDDDLPFYRGYYVDSNGGRRYVLCKKDHTDCPETDHRRCGIKSLSNWSNKTITDFCRDQWSVLAPEFRNRSGFCPHMDFEENTVLPFIEDYSDKTMCGGLGDVWMVRIHEAHHDLWDSNNTQGSLLAIKRLLGKSVQDFNTECNFVRSITAVEKPHPHLMKLLATYKYQGRFHLIFPCAEANLRTYWNSVRLGNWNEETCIWSLKQLYGLVDGLRAIHVSEIENLIHPPPDSVVSNRLTTTSVARAQGAQGLRVKAVNEKRFGRHGDLKPENIMRLQDGTLQITDFGLGRFHRLESRARADSLLINGSTTYSPPELAVDGGLISRAYDIWSLGCIFLEFITWLMEGAEGLEKFTAQRLAPADNGDLDDIYYSVELSEVGKRVNVYLRSGVTEWIHHLRSNSHHSEMVLDFLEIIENEMLVIQPKSRISAENLTRKMSEILERGTRDHEYLLGTRRDVFLVDRVFAKRDSLVRE